MQENGQKYPFLITVNDKVVEFVVFIIISFVLVGTLVIYVHAACIWKDRPWMKWYHKEIKKVSVSIRNLLLTS